jgi:hypothetical protein
MEFIAANWRGVQGNKIKSGERSGGGELFRCGRVLQWRGKSHFGSGILSGGKLPLDGITGDVHLQLIRSVSVTLSIYLIVLNNGCLGINLLLEVFNLILEVIHLLEQGGYKDSS